jgi:LmbE family N-acetylglucosaminyl deacetylase
LKDTIEELASRIAPDMIFTHRRTDLHQDHRVVAELTWNAFRDHMILEYEIPKYDGDPALPNVFVPLDEDTRNRKVRAVVATYRSQRDKPWFSEETFHATLRLRGIECRSPSGYAEGFHASKLVLA